MKKIIYSACFIALFFLFAYTPTINAYSLPNTEEINGTEITEPSTLSNVVIFIRFNDESGYTAPRPFSYYVDLFNGIDKVSLRDYYLETSYNQLEINSYFTSATGIIYYNDIYDRSYYQPYDSTSNPNGYLESQRTDREHELLKRALNFVDDNNLISDAIDIDTNDDGIVDSVSFLISGNDDGWNSLLWPHKWSLFSYTDNYGDFTWDAPTINGKNIDSYTFELLGNTRNYDYAVDVAVLAHETFHLIGAPDLYHYYRYDWIQAIGYWGLMENLNDDPNHMLGYMKEAYGNWITSVDEITSSGSYTLYPLQDSPDNLYKYNTGFSNEYIYFEYRDNDGLYERNLPDTGLLVYRVDLDYYDQGNVYGYYNEDGVTEEEVFVFRPNIIYEGNTIVFPETDDPDVDEDGDIDSAILSDTNAYDSMGIGTDIPIFTSDGNLLNIHIYNVVEHDGYITFDVMFPPSITLNTDEDIDETTDLFLVDLPGTYYEVVLNNIPESADVYYTLDGTTPNTSSLVYTGENIEIDSLHNEVNVSIYLDGLFYQSLSKAYQFTTSIESDHNPYGNMQNISWLVQYAIDYNVTLSFSNNFLLEDDYDFVFLSADGSTQSYTGSDLQNQERTYLTDSVLLQFVSDEYLDDFYGFSCEVVSTAIEQIQLIGLNTIDVEVFDSYLDAGYTTYFDDPTYYVTTSNNINTDVLGIYEVSYTLYDGFDQIITTVTRTVNVIDGISPSISLTGESEITLSVFDTYLEAGAITSDNYDTLTLDYVVVGSVETSTIGTYTLTYSTTDTSGNVSDEITRIIHVVDNVSPDQVLIGESIVTIEVFSDYIELGVSITDNYDDTDSLQYNVVGTVDTSVIGTYELTYTTIDTSLNVSETIHRTVRVVDTQAPEQVIIGEANITLEVFSNYIESGISISDNYDQVVELEYVVSGAVNTSVIGTYILTYTTTDSSGNISSEVIRTIHVVDTQAPVLQLNPSIDTLYINQSYLEAGVTFTDNYDDDLTVEIIGTVSTNTANVFELVYQVEDQSGNIGTISRFVTVIALENMEFVCTQEQTTYTLNSDYDIPTCRVNGTNVSANTNAVNPALAGTYEISYTYEYNTVTYTYKTYVFFYNFETLNTSAVLTRREDFE